MTLLSRIVTCSAGRTALSIAAVACTIGFTERAEAGSWNCSQIDSGRETGNGVTAIRTSSGESVAFYGFSPSTASFARYSFASSPFSSWSALSFDGPGKAAMANVDSPGVTASGGFLWASYPDQFGNVWLSKIDPSHLGSAATSEKDSPFDFLADPTIAPSVVPYVHSNGDTFLHIFYSDNQSPTSAVHEALFDVSTSTWFSGMVMDGGPPGSVSAIFPAAIAWNSTLRVFYLKNGQILERVTSDGSNSNWGPTHVISGSISVNTTVGKPSVIVGSDSVLHVFFSDASGKLHESACDSTGSTWTPDPTGTLVDPTSGVFGVAAPVLVNSGSTLEVYYINNNDKNLKEAALVSGAWQTSVVDGVNGRCAGAVSDFLLGIPAAVAVGTTPQVFYFDNTTGGLRVATYTN